MFAWISLNVILFLKLLGCCVLGAENVGDSGNQPSARYENIKWIVSIIAGQNSKHGLSISLSFVCNFGSGIFALCFKVSGADRAIECANSSGKLNNDSEVI